jgi:hypothetical protein
MIAHQNLSLGPTDHQSAALTVELWAQCEQFFLRDSDALIVCKEVGETTLQRRAVFAKSGVSSNDMATFEHSFAQAEILGACQAKPQ